MNKTFYYSIEIVYLSLIFSILQGTNKLFSMNNVYKRRMVDKLILPNVNIIDDSCKTITIYIVNNKTNETLAKIELTAVIKSKKIIDAKSRVIANNLDNVNTVKHLSLSLENDFVILQARINTGLFLSNSKWVGDVSASIFLGLTKEGNLKSFTFNDNKEISNLRFGGDFFNQAKGVFKTHTSICEGAAKKRNFR
jgi:hypothetical protein